jgi:TolB-like protein/Tfp pilus assembly protein PilF
MVRADGLVKILDFGLAKLTAGAASDPEGETRIHSDTQPGMIMGTVAYMSPQQARGQAVDRRADVWSLGVVLYEMLSGRQPFRGETPTDTLANILRREPEPLDIGALPADLAQIVGKMLAKDLDTRYSTITDVIVDLKSLQKRIEFEAEFRRTPLPNTTTEAQTQMIESAAPRHASGAAIDSGAARADEGFWIAVLPFKYRGANADLEALAEGLSEEIVTGLSRFSYLQVVARSSTLRFTGEATDIRTVGKELGARYLMEGSLRQAGSVLRVSVQLVDTNTGAHLWAENYNRTFSPESVFELQDDLVPRIVSTIADWYGVLPHSMSEALRSKDSDQLSPYAAVLRSIGFYERVTAEEHAAARAGLERAVQQSPGNADGWAMLSMMYGEEHRFGFNVRPDPLGRSLQAARRAVDAAHANHFAWLALAQALFFRKEFDSFRDAAERAIALNPMDGSTIEYIGHLIAFSGDWERGCDMAERARQLNPNHPGWYWAVPFYSAYRNGDYQTARTFVLKLHMPTLFFSYVMLAAVYGQLGEREAAGQALRDLLRLKPDFALTGRDELAKWYLPELVEQLMDGLRKAGLEVVEADGAAAARLATESGRTGAGLVELKKTQSAIEHTAPSTPSIAVLPFKNMSADEENEYFCDGLAEELLNALARIEELKVAARTSAFSFKGKNKNISEIGRQLSVNTVLEGSVRKSGNRIRITVQLVNASDGYHLWSERYDREMQDIFEVQDEITLAVVDALKLKLFGDEKGELLKRGTQNAEAYQLYLKGRFFANRFTVEGIEKAIELYEQATAIDSEYAMAHVGISDAYFFLGIPDATTGILSPQESLPKALAAAEKALEIDPSLGDAWGALAHVKEKSYDVQGARDAYKKSFALGMNEVNWRFHYGIFLSTLGEHEKAIAEIKRARELDPLSAPCAACMGYVLHNARQYEDAIREVKKALELVSAFPLAHQLLGMSYVQERDYDQAIKAFQAAGDYSHRSIVTVASLAHAYAVSGNRSEAEKLLDELLELSILRYVSPYSIAKIYVGLNEKEKAFEFLERAWAEKNIEMVFINVEPCLDPLREDPRFADLVKRIGLPQYLLKCGDSSPLFS